MIYLSYGKRTVDLMIAISSIIALSGIMLFIAVLIKLFDPGPILFSQNRVGKNGKLFKFYKFRSMPVGTGNISSDKLGKVSLTWVGKLIRRTNLDELPQLFNIIKGEMSIVGPRPSLPSQDELVALRSKNGALKCKPGLTGLAQIKSFDGMTVEQKANLDGVYSERISFVGDIGIILKTFVYLLRPPPVY